MSLRRDAPSFLMPFGQRAQQTHHNIGAAMISQNGLSIEGLTKRYGDLPALDEMTFDVRPGELFGLVGRDGARKTTTDADHSWCSPRTRTRSCSTVHRST
jgi:ABC-type glutathione transport system ATPase component